MTKDLIKKLEALLLEGEKLRSQAGNLFGTKRSSLNDSEYISWMQQSVQSIKQLGKFGENLIQDIENYPNIQFPYEDSIERNLGNLKAALKFAKEPSVTSQKKINPQFLAKNITPRSIKKTVKTMQSFWNLLHTAIVKRAKSRFDSGHFADCVEAALKEVNNTVKQIVKARIGQEFDGADLMNRAFSLQNPIITLSDLSSESGKNIQKGYLQIFSGAMIGIRNPKAHDNIEIDDKRAIHLLFLASLLMYKIDERI